MIDQDQMMQLAEPIKMAMIIVATAPIVIVYPFYKSIS